MAMINPLDKNTSVTLSNGNLTYTVPPATWARTDEPIKGKIYLEAILMSGYYTIFGFATKNVPLAGAMWGHAETITYGGDGTIRANNVVVAGGLGSASDGSIFGIVIDTDNLYFEFYLNGNKLYGGNYSNPQNKELFFFIGAHSGSATGSIILSDFRYSVPNGYKPYGLMNKTLFYHDGKYKNLSPKAVIDYTSLNKIQMNLTSNNSNIGIASSSSVYDSTYTTHRAFDGIIDSIGWASTTPIRYPQWIAFKFNIPRTIGKYIVHPRDSGSEDISQTIKDWTFEASNNGADWVVLDSQKNQIFTTKEPKEYTPANVGVYSHYRIVCTANNGSTLAVAIGELEFYEHIFKDVYFWKDVSSNLPTSQQFLEQGMDSLTPLLDRRVETLNPLKMDSKSEILQVGEDGKVFSKTLDLKKYIDIRNIKVEVE